MQQQPLDDGGGGGCGQAHDDEFASTMISRVDSQVSSKDYHSTTDTNDLKDVQQEAQFSSQTKPGKNVGDEDVSTLNTVAVGERVQSGAVVSSCNTEHRKSPSFRMCTSSKQQLLDNKRKERESELHESFLTDVREEGIRVIWHPRSGAPVRAKLILGKQDTLFLATQECEASFFQTRLGLNLGIKLCCGIPCLTRKETRIAIEPSKCSGIIVGCGTTNLLRTQKYYSSTQNQFRDSRCFSLVSDFKRNSGTYDFEVEDPVGGGDLRDRLVQAFSREFQLQEILQSDASCIPKPIGMIARLNSIVNSKSMNHLIFSAILVSIVAMALSSPLFEVSSVLQERHRTEILLLEATESCVAVLFTIEMVLKIIALEGPAYYARDPWNVLDGSIVLLGWIAEIIVSLSASDTDDGIKFTAFRALRTLRVLRTIKFLAGMRQIVETLIQTLGMVMQGLLVYGYSILVFAGFGFQVFGDALLYKCVASTSNSSWVEDRVTNVSYAIGPLACTPEGSDCDPGWSCQYISPTPTDDLNGFHSIYASVMTVYRIATRAGMGKVLRQLMKVKGVWTILYFLGITFFISFMIFALFVAIIRETFAHVQNMENRTLDEQQVTPTRATFARAASLNTRNLRNSAHFSKATSAKGNNKCNSSQREPSERLAPLRDNWTAPKGQVEQRDSLIRSSTIPHTELCNDMKIKDSIDEMNQDSRDKTKITSEPRTSSGNIRQIGNATNNEREPRTSSGNIRQTGSATNNEREPRTSSGNIKQTGSATNNEFIITRTSSSNFKQTCSTTNKESEQRTTSGTASRCSIKNNGSLSSRPLVAVPIRGIKRVTTLNIDTRLHNEQALTRTTTMRKRPLPPEFGGKRWKSQIVEACYNVVCMPIFDGFVTACIVLNVITLATEHHGQSEQFASVVEVLETIFSVVFTMEVVLKLIAFRGPRNLYLRHPQAKWNVYDSLIVCAALIDVLMANLPGFSGTVNLSVLRVFRLLRIVRVMRKSPDILQIVGALLRSLPAVLNLLTFTALITVVYAVLGMQLYGAKMINNDLTNRLSLLKGANITNYDAPLNLDFVSSRLNFDTFPNAVTALFVAMTGGPQWIVFSQALSTDIPMSVPFYFISFSIFTTYVTLNFMVVIIMSNFKLSGDEVERQRKERERVIMNSLHLENIGGKAKGNLPNGDLRKRLRESVILLRHNSVETSEAPSSPVHNYTAQPASREADIVRVPKQGTLLWLKQVVGKLRNSTSFEVVIIICIIGSSITLAFESPAHDNDVDLQFATSILDVVFLATFAVEFLVKIIVDGVSTKHTWIRLQQLTTSMCVGNSTTQASVRVQPTTTNLEQHVAGGRMNVVPTKKSQQEAVNTSMENVVCESKTTRTTKHRREPTSQGTGYFDDGWNRLDFIVLLATMISLFGKSKDTNGITRIFRVGRILRPLRMINKNKGMKVIVDALLRAIKPVSYTALLLLWFFFTFSVVGVQFYGGKFYSCNDPLVTTRSTCQGTFVVSNFLPLNTSVLVKYPTSEPGQLESREWNNSHDFHFDNVPASLATLFEVIAIKGWTEKLFAASDVTEIDLQPYRNSNSWAIYFFFPFIFFGSFFMMKLFVGVIVTTFRQFSGNALLTPAQLRWIEMKRAMARIRPKPRLPTSYIERLVLETVSKPSFSKFFTVVLLTHLGLIIAIPSVSDVESSDTGVMVHWVFTSLYCVEVYLKVLIYRPRAFINSNPSNVVDLLSACCMVVVPIVFGEYRGLVYIKAMNVSRLVVLFESLSGLGKLTNVLALCALPMVNVTCIFAMLLYVYAVIGMQLFAEIEHGTMIGSTISFYTVPESMLSLYQIVAGENWITIMRDCTDHCERVGNSDCTAANVSAKLYFYSLYLVFFGVFINLYAATIIDAYWTIDKSNSSVGYSREKWKIGQEDFDKFRSTWEYFDPLNKGCISLRWLAQFMRHLGPPLAPRVDSEKIKYLEVRLEVVEHLTTRGTCADGPSGNVLKDTAAFGFYSTLQVLSISQLPLEHLDLEERVFQIAKSMAIREELSAMRIQAAYRGWQFRQLVKFLAAWRRYGEEMGSNVTTMNHAEKVKLIEHYIASNAEYITKSAPMSLRDAMTTKGQISAHVVESLIQGAR